MKGHRCECVVFVKKLPQATWGLLGSFGFKGLSCPKTGEFDYNPLPSVSIDAMPVRKKGAFTTGWFQFDGKKRLPTACGPFKF